MRMVQHCWAEITEPLEQVQPRSFTHIDRRRMSLSGGWLDEWVRKRQRYRVLMLKKTVVDPTDSKISSVYILSLYKKRIR